MTGLLLLTEGGLGACLMEPPASFHPMAGHKVVIGKQFLALLKPLTVDPNSMPGGTDLMAVSIAPKTGEWIGHGEQHCDTTKIGHG